MSDKVSTLLSQGRCTLEDTADRQRFFSFEEDGYTVTKRLRKAVVNEEQRKWPKPTDSAVEEDDVDTDIDLALDLEEDYESDEKAGEADETKNEEDEEEGDPEQDDQDDQDDIDLLWDTDVAGGNWILRSGTVTVGNNGVAEINGSITVTQIDPGFFAYNPVWQRLAFDVIVLQAVLAEIAIAVCDSVSESGFDAKSACQQTSKIAQEVGLTQLLDESKTMLSKVVTSIQTLRAATKYDGETPDEAADRYAHELKVGRKTRARALQQEVKAKGNANSEERHKQLDSLPDLVKKYGREALQVRFQHDRTLIQT